MLTPTQMCMARAAMDYTTRQLGQALGVSAMAISRYEHGDEKVMSVATIKRAQAFFEQHRIFFGPKDGVCLQENVFASERWLGLACYQMLLERGIRPSSGELLAAYGRMTEEVS